MKSAVIYSSLTGNTRALAEAILEAMPEGTALYPVGEAPDPDSFEFLALGFWVSKSGPDPKMTAYMAKLKGKTLALFGTMCGYPDSGYGARVKANAEALVAERNRVLGTFLCMGRLQPKRLEGYLSGNLVSKKHPLTPERRARLMEAAKHPNEEDFKAARAAFEQFITGSGSGASLPR